MRLVYFYEKRQISAFVKEIAIELKYEKVPARTAVAMTTIAIIGLTYRTEKKPLLLAWDSIGILLMYVINLMLLYMMR